MRTLKPDKAMTAEGKLNLVRTLRDYLNNFDWRSRNQAIAQTLGQIQALLELENLPPVTWEHHLQKKLRSRSYFKVLHRDSHSDHRFWGKLSMYSSILDVVRTKRPSDFYEIVDEVFDEIFYSPGVWQAVGHLEASIKLRQNGSQSNRVLLLLKEINYIFTIRFKQRVNECS